MEVPESPFRFFVEPGSSVGTGQVTAYGPGLSQGRTGEQASFTIVTRDSGAGSLSLAVEGPSKADINCHDNRDGTCSVDYLPLLPGDYTIAIKFMEAHIPGSPFTARVFGEPRRRTQVSVGTTSDVPLKISETDIHNLTASVQAPSGLEEPCLLKRMPNGSLGISFTPKETGEHLIKVLRLGRPIPNSPFKIHVGESELGNAGRVRVYGDGLRAGMAHQDCQFFVDTRQAGYGSLNLSIEGPSKALIDCRDSADGACQMTYRPSEPGTYIINIKYANQEVPGSPFVVTIGGDPSSQLIERISRRREAADVTQIGSQCELTLKIPGAYINDLRATVTSPSGATERCDIQDLHDSHFAIRFIPKEMGVHTVSVRQRDHHVPGSPFQFTVGPILEGGAPKVRTSGRGLEVGGTGRSNEFSISTREAGAGGLSIAIEGPSKAEIDFEDRKDGSCLVSYRVSHPGEYFCSIKFNDEHIPGSPFRIQVEGDVVRLGESGMFTSSSHGIYNDIKQMSVASVQDRVHRIGQAAHVTVSYNAVANSGSVRAYVITPSGRQEEASLQRLPTGNQWAIRFMPHETGPHMVHVNVDGLPVPGSPYRVNVGTHSVGTDGVFSHSQGMLDEANPAMVRAQGPGLSHGRVAERNKFFVDTERAGSGALSVTVDGPSKVQLNCEEQESGYEFNYVPSLPGQYLIAVKYGGNHHITGSPFRVNVTGDACHHESDTLHVGQTAYTVPASGLSTAPSDATRVQCQGAGLHAAQLGQPSQFHVDGGQAGADVLFVGVRGPSRTPCEQVNIRHLGQQQYAVQYAVRERGRHALMVKWGDQHVPGSPFVVIVP